MELIKNICIIVVALEVLLFTTYISASSVFPYVRGLVSKYRDIVFLYNLNWTEEDFENIMADWTRSDRVGSFGGQEWQKKYNKWYSSWIPVNFKRKIADGKERE